MILINCSFSVSSRVGVPALQPAAPPAFHTKSERDSNLDTSLSSLSTSSTNRALGKNLFFWLITSS